MTSGSIARRYAKALFDLAPDSTRMQAWTDALLALERALAGSAELRDVLVNPAFSRGQRRAVVAQLAEALRFDPEPTNLLFLLGDRNRLDQLDAIIRFFGALADAKLGRVRAKLTSATPLDDRTAQAISDKLARATGAQVILDRQVDAALVGGAVAEVGSLTYDGSIRTQLEALRRTLKA